MCDLKKKKLVIFTWDADKDSVWKSMRECIDVAINRASKNLRCFSDNYVLEVKVKISSNGKTSFSNDFRFVHKEYSEGSLPSLKTIIVFGDFPNYALTHECLNEMNDFLKKNIPIIACICGKQDLTIDEYGYFHCWCPNIKMVARMAAQRSEEVYRSLGLGIGTKFWCLSTGNALGEESSETYKSWLSGVYGFKEDQIKCVNAENEFSPGAQDIVFITGFGPQYFSLAKTALQYKKSNTGVSLIFDQSVADPENLNFCSFQHDQFKTSVVEYIDFVPAVASEQHGSIKTENKFSVLPYVAFLLADKISSKDDARQALRELPFIEVDGETYLIPKSSIISAPISLMNATVDNESGCIYEISSSKVNSTPRNSLSQEKLGFLLQGVAEQLSDLSVHSIPEEIEAIVKKIEGVFREALSGCSIGIDLPVVYDGSKMYCSKTKGVLDAFRSARAIEDIYGFRDLIQVALTSDDVSEDNGIARAYVGRVNVKIPVPLRLAGDAPADVDRLVFSRNFDHEVKRERYTYSKSLSCHQKKALLKLVKALFRIGDDGGARYVYLIPYSVTELRGGMLLIASQNKFSYLTGRVINAISEQIFSSIAGILKSQALECANVKSAIGSIMSRNGSHNIGSHVLAALSHNVGTMPDDRVLYQYIQHRMDYIATATTDRPQWRQPTMMVAGLMKEFLKQRHLLDHVCGSEELHAYKFQGQSVDDNANNAIRIHIRRVKDEVEKGEQRVFFAKTTKKNGGKVSDGNVFDFIDYAQGEMRNLDTDIALAIPGGVVGNHAFYTIIENVLRNAAKHEWAESLRVWKMACELLGEDVCLKEYAECQPRHLDVYVDFRDDPSNGKVQCRIWNDRVVSVENTAKIKTAILVRLIKNSVEENDGSRWKDRLLSAAKTLTYLYSRLKKRTELKNDRLDFEGRAFYQGGNELYALIKRRAEDVEERRATLSDDEKLRFDSDLELRNSLVAGLCNNFIGAETSVNSIRGFLYEGMVIGGRDLRIGLEEKIRKSFIDESTGSLRKENWGIAEMRISAGYLQCSETGQIGGLPGAGDPCKIIWPVLVKNDDGDECVAYRFDVDKPKLLLVVLKSKCDDILTLRQNSMCYGVDFMCRSEIESGKAYPYSYILFEELDNELKAQLVERKVMLPYRQLYASIDEPCGALEEYVPEYSGTFFRELASKLAALKGSKEGAAKVCYQLLEEVYAAWLVHIQNRVFLQRNEGRLPNLVIDMGTDSSSGSGKTLVSRYELLKFVFENSFNAAIRSFLAENGPDTVALETRTETRQTCLSRESGLIPPKVAAVLYAVAQMRTRNVAKDFSKRVKALWSVPEIVDEQLMSWMREVIGSAKKVFINLDEISPEWDRYWSRKFNLISQRDVSIEVGAIEDFDDEDCDYWLGRFENYISSTIVDQAEAFLSKYEERYVTLPVIPERKNDDTGCAEGNSSPSFSWGKLNLIVTSESKVRDRAVVNNDICYFRHGTKTQTNIGDNYYEPLSGSQSTFNAFASLRRDLKRSNDAAVHCEIVRFLTRLVENAAMRVLIVDERVAKFVRDHSEVGDILGGLRIAVADDTELNVMRMFSSERIDDSLLFSGVELKKFEIVVIHQGIIDKLLHGHEDKIKVKVWLDGLVKKLHYVVITTGRGSPANIPDTARVLPYSVIENSILQRYPEKILLVDAIMNILPVRKQKES